MKPVFLDTSGWFAVASAREARHREAQGAYQRLVATGAQLVTTNLVVAEMHAMVLRSHGGAEGVRFLDGLYQDPSHEVVFVDRDLEREAVARWLRRFSDKRLSLTDAVSFEVMRTRRIREVLALDKHFEIAGFTLTP